VGAVELASEWLAAAEQIRADILVHGVSDRGVFRQHYETDALDASTLLIPLVRFLPPDDEQVKATVLAIESELEESGFILRYRVDETDDGLTGEEGTFLICSFWLVSALSEIGEANQARELCERLLAHASPLGLYAEELEESTGRHLGNYPQALTHLALINAVMHVISHEGPRPDGVLGPPPAASVGLVPRGIHARAGGVADSVGVVGRVGFVTAGTWSGVGAGRRRAAGRGSAYYVN
jgi:alpha,alpha-trehalase